MIEAALVVQSRELTLDEISAVVGREPDSGYDRGSLAPVSQTPRQWTSWSLDLEWPTEVHGGTEGLAKALTSLGQTLAACCAELAERGCEIVISVNQELADTPASMGLYLSPEAVRWMATAGAALGVDQYVAYEHESP